MVFALKLTTDGKRVGLNYPDYQTYEMISEGVGGLIECVALTPTLDMYVNEEGKILGLPYNPDATAVFWSHFGFMSDIVVGDVVFSSHDEEGNTVSLNDDEMRYLQEHLGDFGDVD